jgi:thioredoxin-related protein
MAEVKWHSSMIYARDLSWTEKKPIMLNFVDPDSPGCKEMDKVTFSQDPVVQYVQEHLVPLRLEHDNKPFARDYNVIWTPTLIFLDEDGKEFQRSIGFMEADELVPALMLAVAKRYLLVHNYVAARVHLDEILSVYPKSVAAPEALYFSGVCLYKKKNDPRELNKTWAGLQAKYPDSVWARSASPYQF